MRGKKIRLLSKKSSEYQVFDRSALVAGTTKNGVDIPSGGVLLQNKILAGYLQVGGAKKWRIIGTVDQTDKNIKYIGTYGQTELTGQKRQTGGTQVAPTQKSQKIQEDYPNHPKSLEKKKVSLRSAVNMLREYYREQFN